MSARVSRGAPNLKLHLALLLMGGLFVGWRVLTLGMAEHLVKSDSPAAIAWRDNYAPALLEHVASTHLRDPKRTLDTVAVAKALSSSPLDGLGFRLLARDAEVRGDRQKAAALYALAVARGPRDLPSQAWLVELELNHREFAAAIDRIDLMLRIQPELINQFTPILARLALHPPAQAALAATLAEKPIWRTGFMMTRPTPKPDLAALFPFVELVKRTPGGMTSREMAWWIDSLAGARQWGPAYIAWVQSLSPAASARIGNVFNGGFELEPSNSGFDWRILDVAGARTSRVQVTGAKEGLALRVEFEDRRVPFQNVSQLLALAPGDYQLRGRRRLDDLRTERGLVWTLSCAEDGKPLAESEPMSGRREWQAFTLDFSVPPSGCGGQWLVLRVPARIAAEQLIGGTAWFDDMQVKSR